MIEKELGTIMVVCDLCGEVLNSKHEKFASKKEIENAIASSGWGIKDSTVYCNKCEKI